MKNNQHDLDLELEQLEDRTMLSAVEVFAAGATNQETIQLKIDDAVVRTWENIGGDADAGEFVKLTFATDQGISADRIKIEFINDKYDPSNGIDRNVRIDKIVLDGKAYQSEAPRVFSTGTWLAQDGIQPGFRESEYLHGNGFLQFASDEEPSTLIEIQFRGSTGDEEFDVEIGGEKVARFQASTESQIQSIRADGRVTADQVRIVFVNDLYDPVNGVDRNLIVDRIIVDGVAIETESDAVFSTGSWKAEDGIQPGFRNSEILNANGYFQFGTPITSPEGGLADVVARSEFGTPNSISEVNNPAVTAFVRVTTPSYPGNSSGEQWNAPERSSSPQTPPNAPVNVGSAVQPVKITDTIFGAESEVNRPNSGGLNEFSQFFAQFVAHDLAQSLTGDGAPIFYDGQQIPLTRTPSVVIDGVRQSLSSETKTLDLGMVYGRDAIATQALREVSTVNGQRVAGAKLIAGGAGDVLPTFAEVAAHRGQSVAEVQAMIGVSPLPFPPEVLANHVATGDERSNQTLSLLVHHTIWHRNHNWHVDQLRGQNPNWSEEQLYQAARALNEAEYQKVVYTEYLPKLIGDANVSNYTGFDPNVDNSIINEWTTIAFRFGHDQASSGQNVVTEDGEVTFVSLTENSQLGNAGQSFRTNEMLGDWTRGQLSQFSQEIDGRVVSTLRNNLFAVPNPGQPTTFLKFNLPLLDIHRGRDHGVSDYNQLRAGLGLSTYDSFEHFAADNGLGQARLDQLKSVYSDISQMDSIVGGLLEAKAPGSQLGETFTKLNVMQFEATRNGDAFFYLNRFKDSPEVVAQINESSMSEILRRTGIITHDQGNAFQGQSNIGSVIQVTGRGQTGDEIMVLQVDGEDVASWKVSTAFANYDYRSNEVLTADRVRIAFRNDAYDPVNGYDRNLIVDKISIDGRVTETESNKVFSTGSWKSEDGIVSGFRLSETLHAKGFFQFGFASIGEVSTFDGRGNNVSNPEFGASNENFLRQAPAAYADGLNSPSLPGAPNARLVSDTISAQDRSVENDRFISSVWFQWGQFIDHDIAQAFTLDRNAIQEPLPINGQFPFTRTVFNRESGIDSPREQFNHISAFIDGGMIYGSDTVRAAALRAGQGGRMASVMTDAGELLPPNIPGVPNAAIPTPDFFVAGDVRANENLPLLAMHTLWVREHNRYAESLAQTEFAGSDLSDAAVDEEIYQRTRQYISGMIQHITYNEFLPSILGFNAIETYKGYDPTINAQITNEFTTVFYRLGHTTLPNEILIGKNGEKMSLADAFNNPNFVTQNGIDGIFDGIVRGKIQEVDHLVVDGVRNLLTDGPGFDLVARNLQRGRDHGLPDYNTMRESLGLKRINSFDEVISNHEVAEKLEMLYGSPDNADPWIVAISEDHVAGSSVGESIRAAMIDQFSRLRDGDRFYFENHLDQDLVAEIKRTRLSDIITRNTNAKVQTEVFWTPDTLVFRNGLDNKWLIRDFGDQGGAEVVFLGEQGVRDPNNLTETTPVRRNEPINAVVVAGINPGSDGFFIPNSIVPFAQADRGVDEFVITASIDFFEGYGLGGDDRWVIESDVRSVFASGDAGTDILAVKSDVSGGKISLVGGGGYDEITVVAPFVNHVFADGGLDNDRIYLFVNQDSPLTVKGEDYPFIVSPNHNLGQGPDVYWSNDPVVTSKKSEVGLAHAYTWYEIDNDGWKEELTERFNREFDGDVELGHEINVRHFRSVI